MYTPTILNTVYLLLLDTVNIYRRICINFGRIGRPVGVCVRAQDRKGTNGVSTNGVTAIFMFFDGGTFWALPFTYFYIS